MAGITSPQLKRLQVLYSQMARRTFEGTDRESRLAWASKLCCRPITSFSDLTQDDARHLIDTLQAQLGVKAPSKRPRLRREAAERAGNEGRRRDTSNQSTMAGPQDLARIQYALDLLGWNEAQFNGWLKSTRSPLGHRSNPQILTVGDANRVWWALKNMAKARGLWKEKLSA